MKLVFIERFLKTLIKFLENSSNGAELFRADWWKYRQTDTTKLIVAFRNFVNAPKNRSRVVIFKLYENISISTKLNRSGHIALGRSFFPFTIQIKLHLNEKLAALLQSKFKCVQHTTPRPFHNFRESRINLQWFLIYKLCFCFCLGKIFPCELLRRM